MVEKPVQAPVSEKELNAELSDPRLLARLGVEEIILLDVERYRVTIGSPFYPADEQVDDHLEEVIDERFATVNALT